MYESKSWVLGKELAQIFNVTDRTIRNDIIKITNQYGEGLILSHARQGYSVNQDLYEKLIQKTDAHLFLDSDERIVYIIHQLLFQNESLDLF